jgi:acyl-CoA synthetase (AMP-forming)/AMP-acid ligase II
VINFKKINIGKNVVKFNRMRSYAQTIPSLMVVILFFEKFGMAAVYTIPLIILGFILLLKLDTNKIHQEEADYSLSKSSKFRQLCNDVEDIKKRMDTINDY